MTREDWLYAQLERENLPEKLRVKFEAEVNEIAERLGQKQEAEKLEAEKEQKRLKELEEIAREGGDGAFAVAQAEFSDDYEVLKDYLKRDTYTVVSHVAKSHHPGSYTFDTKEEAEAKYRWLLLQRLYDKYVRAGMFAKISDIKPDVNDLIQTFDIHDFDC
jgi:hypothetical protein